MFALTAIKGIGRRYSNIVLKKADVDLSKRAGELTEEEVIISIHSLKFNWHCNCYILSYKILYLKLKPFPLLFNLSHWYLVHFVCPVLTVYCTMLERPKDYLYWAELIMQAYTCVQSPWFADSCSFFCSGSGWSSIFIGKLTMCN